MSNSMSNANDVGSCCLSVGTVRRPRPGLLCNMRCRACGSDRSTSSYWDSWPLLAFQLKWTGSEDERGEEPGGFFLLTTCDEKHRVVRGRCGKMVKRSRTNKWRRVKSNLPIPTPTVLHWCHADVYSHTSQFADLCLFNINNAKAKIARSPLACCQKRKRTAALWMWRARCQIAPQELQPKAAPFHLATALLLDDLMKCPLEWFVTGRSDKKRAAKKHYFTLNNCDMHWDSARGWGWGWRGWSILLLTQTASQVEVTFTTRRRLWTPCSPAQHAAILEYSSERRRKTGKIDLFNPPYWTRLKVRPETNTGNDYLH